MIVRLLRGATVALLVAAVGVAPVFGQTDSTSPLRLVLNVAAFRLAVHRHDSLIASYSVAIGTPQYPTPIGTFAVSSIEWNPWWIPPASDWARGEAPRPPGPTNPMGRVKLNFKPLYFLHGTPEEASIGRAASHGCVRMTSRDAIALATMVMEDGIPAADSAQVGLLVRDTTATSTWLLDRPVPLEIVSRLLEVERDTLYGFLDPYSARRITEALVLETLARNAGVVVPDSVAIREFVAEALRRPAKMALARLVRPAQ